jgi:hypothetical protein
MDTVQPLCWPEKFTSKYDYLLHCHNTVRLSTGHVIYNICQNELNLGKIS